VEVATARERPELLEPAWERTRDTSMSFPATGDYRFPGGPATVRIDCSEDRGAYWEPNVWMPHRLLP
jgi:hypothetical protein